MNNQFLDLSSAMCQDSLNGSSQRDFLQMQIKCASECGLITRHEFSTLQFAAECYYEKK